MFCCGAWSPPCLRSPQWHGELRSRSHAPSPSPGARPPAGLSALTWPPQDLPLCFLFLPRPRLLEAPWHCRLLLCLAERRCWDPFPQNKFGDTRGKPGSLLSFAGRAAVSFHFIHSAHLSQGLSLCQTLPGTGEAAGGVYSLDEWIGSR